MFILSIFFISNNLCTGFWNALGEGGKEVPVVSYLSTFSFVAYFMSSKIEIKDENHYIESRFGKHFDMAFVFGFCCFEVLNFLSSTLPKRFHTFKFIPSWISKFDIGLRVFSSILCPFISSIGTDYNAKQLFSKLSKTIIYFSCVLILISSRILHFRFARHFKNWLSFTSFNLVVSAVQIVSLGFFWMIFSAPPRE